MERILFLLAAAHVRDAADALRSAREKAFDAHRLSFGLLLTEEPEGEELRTLQRLGACQFLVPAADPWLEVEELWQGESCILLGSPEMRFARHWDFWLLRELRQCQQNNAPPASVLTGYLPRVKDVVNAVSPVAAESFDAEGRLCFQRGTPLRYAACPQRCAFLHPRFCFGPAAFFRQLSHSDVPRFLAAFQQRWDIYTLSKPVVTLEEDDPLPPCPVEGDTKALQRFEKRFGLRVQTRQLSPVLRQGLTGTELTFPSRVPLPIRAQEAAHRFLAQGSRARPMCVTCWLRLPLPPANLPEEYVCWFRRLSAVKGIPLTCYAEGDRLRRLAEIHPNVLEYKRRYALPVKIKLSAEDAFSFFLLSKPFLLAQSRTAYPHQSHYIWLDFGYLRYPVYAGASVRWDAVCKDTICLAQVNGRPDTSMLVVPTERLDALCDEVRRICAAALEQAGALPSEEQTWRRMLQDHPDWFTLINRPGARELLSLTMLSREEELHALI